MGLYGDYIKAAQESGNPAAFVKEYASPIDVSNSLAGIPTKQTHNAAPVNNKLANYTAPKATVNNASQYYQAGREARLKGTNKYGNGGQALAESATAPKPAAKTKDKDYYTSEYRKITGEEPPAMLSDDRIKAFVDEHTGNNTNYVQTPEEIYQSGIIEKTDDSALEQAVSDMDDQYYYQRYATGLKQGKTPEQIVDENLFDTRFLNWIRNNLQRFNG